MAEIGFYHLTRTTTQDALPALLGRTLSAGQRAVILCGSEDRLAALDTALWQCQNPDWLPHGSAATGYAAQQPIWLTLQDEEAPNGARFLFLIDGMSSARLDNVDRAFDLFDGNDGTAVAAARQRWVSAKAGGHTLSYWQQGPQGWERKQ
ncbi:DNA polymerase III subunit chi [Acidisoma cellulosilytica]|uniref:DNA polymerase III subunit chi n=1 Tax=Acidisoma cellulosilyticum TaxID=2802395 RepID=A0A963Z1L8_9PROT|nr:DNA polymerase III subunit chi [Acidisoma cellulosilyticum]MCB8880163.1 DNA polymerase III subunit chi [Acidisoma cellulosilyticum]